MPYHQSPTNTKYSRQSQSLLPQTNGESTKSTNHKSHEKLVQNVNTTKPSIHHTVDDDNNSSQTNIVTIIVNNSNIDSTINNVDESLTATNNSNNKTFDLKIEQRIVSKINENCKGVEKNDIPCVNIKSSIEVKQNGNDNKEYDDNVIQGKTPIVSMTSKPAVKIIEEESQNKEIKDTPTVESKSETQIQEVPVSAPPPTSTSSIPAVQPQEMSWASLLRKGSEPQVSGTNKPTALIAPNNAISVNNDQTEIITEKTQSFKKSCKKNYYQRYENKSSIIDDTQQKNDAPIEQRKPLHTEVPQIHCDDPITYRMGGK